MESFRDLICFKLGSATRRIQKYYNNRYGEYGITIAQSFILFSLLESDGLSIKNLAERLNIDSSAITGLVDRLEKESLVERRVDPKDRRSFSIFLTNKGKNLAETVLPIAVEFNEKLKTNLGEEQEESLKTFLCEIEKLEA
ncbi:MAG: MarR family transcriptional regulator [Proteobacteria bacterium]|nr:MarR family transcriptional regulator [Pseudomonadota bacterium]